MEWISVKDKMPEPGVRVATYSPVYEKDQSMKYRMVDSQFLRLCTDVTHWCEMRPPNTQMHMDKTPRCSNCDIWEPTRIGDHCPDCGRAFNQ